MDMNQTLGDGEGQGSLACCSPLGHKESDMTECLRNNTVSLLTQVCNPISLLLKAARGLKLVPTAHKRFSTVMITGLDFYCLSY